MNATIGTEKKLKGEGFHNRYRLTGKLTTRSPLHVGTGEEVEKGKPTPIIKDERGKPLIPGSALKGVMRNWLWSVLAGMGDEWAKIHEYTSAEYSKLSQEEQQDMVKTKFSWLELLFGTPFHEGKVEVWDATCKTGDLQMQDALLKWNHKSLTYVDTSVAIDPATGTAMEHLLYQYEVVPPGVEFELNVSGQNLNELELGMLLLAIQGFNSEIYPIQVGARSGRGYGRMQLEIKAIKCLDSTNAAAWIKGIVQGFGETAQKSDAGYFRLPELAADRQKELIQNVKKALLERMGG